MSARRARLGCNCEHDEGRGSDEERETVTATMSWMPQRRSVELAQLTRNIECRYNNKIKGLIGAGLPSFTLIEEGCDVFVWASGADHATTLLPNWDFAAMTENTSGIEENERAIHRQNKQTVTGISHGVQ